MKTDQLANKAVEGEVTLTKVDEFDGTPLAGAEFTLEYNQGGTGNWIQYPDHHTTYTTDADGNIHVTGLKGGGYRFIEMTAPTDYVQSDLANPIYYEFTIDVGQLDATVEATNKLIPGSVKLTKIRTGYPDQKIAGAEFELYYEKEPDKWIQVGGSYITNTDGEITVDNLRPGDYQFIETRAPRNYYLNTEPVEFTIDRNPTIQVEVTAENRRRPSDGGSYFPPEPEEPERPEEDLDKPEELKEPTQPEEDPEEPVDPEQPEEPETLRESEEPGADERSDEQGADQATGVTSDQSLADPSALGRNNNLLADADIAQSKQLLPQTGERLPWTPFFGLLFIAFALVLWFRKNKVQV